MLSDSLSALLCYLRHGILFVLICCLPSSWAQEPAGGPTNEKAQKTFKEASELEKKHSTMWALEGFKKADKQDGGHCAICQEKMVRYGIALREWKTAELAASELVAGAKGNKETAIAHYHFGKVESMKGSRNTKTSSSPAHTTNSPRPWSPMKTFPTQFTSMA